MQRETVIADYNTYLVPYWYNPEHRQTALRSRSQIRDPKGSAIKLPPGAEAIRNYGSGSLLFYQRDKDLKKFYRKKVMIAGKCENRSFFSF
jgi:hypothetical protein